MHFCTILQIQEYPPPHRETPFHSCAMTGSPALASPVGSAQMMQKCTRPKREIVKKIFFDAKTHHFAVKKKNVKKITKKISLIQKWHDLCFRGGNRRTKRLPIKATQHQECYSCPRPRANADPLRNSAFSIKSKARWTSSAPRMSASSRCWNASTA